VLIKDPGEFLKFLRDHGLRNVRSEKLVLRHIKVVVTGEFEDPTMAHIIPTSLGDLQDTGRLVGFDVVHHDVSPVSPSTCPPARVLLTGPKHRGLS
jgi:hypothetical protein